MLNQIKAVAQEANMNKLYLSVERSNIASIKTIKKNGGIYLRSFVYEGELADVYDKILVSWGASVKSMGLSLHMMV